MFSWRDQVETALELADREASQGYLGYLRHVVIDSAPEPAPFRQVARDWQWEDARLLAPALEDVTWHRKGYTGPRNFWKTRARGHDKTTSLARDGLWMLAYSRRPITWVHSASDAEQAAFLTQAMARMLDLNPWLAARVKLTGRKAVGARGHLDVVTSDAASAFGHLPDLISVDELTWWRKPTSTGPQGGLWGALWSARDKRPHCVVTVITNAGVKGSWQHDILGKIRNDPKWVVWDEPRRLPTWMSEADIQHNRRLLPPALARRVIDNIWVDPGEESGFLSRAEVEACEDLGRDLGLVYRLEGERGVNEHVAVIDYGPKRDRTALAVMHQRADGLVVVDKLDVWQGSPESPILIGRVREWLEDCRASFKGLRLTLDPHELEELAQFYEKHMPVQRFEARGGKGNYTMAETLRTCIINRRVAWYPGAGVLPVDGRQETMADELASLVLRFMPYGYRFDHEATKHDDRAVVLGMGLVTVLNRPGAAIWVPPEKLQEDKYPEQPVQRLQRPGLDRATSRGLWGMG